MNGLTLFLALYSSAELHRLGHDQWQERELAQQRLAAFMPMTDAALSQVSGCPERLIRARRIREQWAEDQASWYYRRAKCLRVPGFRLTPWVDSLPPAKVHRSHWLDLARAHPDHRPSNTWEDYRLATILWATDQLRQGVAEAAIIETLAEGAEYEIKWLERNAGTEKWANVLREATGR